MVINYHFEDIDFKRQENGILDIKDENVQLRTSLTEFFKISGITFGPFLLGCLLGVKNSYLFMIIILVMCFTSIFMLYFFQYYQIEYDHIQESLILKKWYGVIHIPKKNLKKVYIKIGYAKSGTNLYINYLNSKNKEKYILLDIFALKLDAIKKIFGYIRYIK